MSLNIRKVAKDLNIEGIVRQGVYTMVGGPNYETVAELKLLRELGVDRLVEVGWTVELERMFQFNVETVSWLYSGTTHFLHYDIYFEWINKLGTAPVLGVDGFYKLKI